MAQHKGSKFVMWLRGNKFVLLSGKWPNKPGQLFKGEMQIIGRPTHDKCEAFYSESGLIFYHGWSNPQPRP